MACVGGLQGGFHASVRSGLPEHIWAFLPRKFSGADLVLTAQLPHARSATLPKQGLQDSECFYLLSSGNQWTPVLAFWVKEKVSDLINQLDRKKYFVWEALLQYQISKHFRSSLLFGTLNNYNSMAQPAFVPGGKDLVPQNCPILFLKLQPLLATPFWPFCCQAELGLETQSTVIQHLIDTLEHKTRLCWLLDAQQT